MSGMIGIWISLLAFPARGDETEAVKFFREKGAKVVESKGVATTLDATDCSQWTEEDFKRLGPLSHLKSLSLSRGLSDRTLVLLAPLQLGPQPGGRITIMMQMHLNLGPCLAAKIT